MSIKCQQCGEIAEHPMNFCRKCGAPLSAGDSSLVAPTMVITPAASAPEPPDPFDTWEPTAPVAVTEVLAAPAVTATAPAPAPVTAKAATAPKQRNLGLLAAAAIGLCAIIGGAVYLLRPSTPASTSASESPMQPIATPTIESAAPTATPMTELAPPVTNNASPRPSPTATVRKAELPKPSAATTQPMTTASETEKYNQPAEAAEPAKPKAAEANTNYIAQGNGFMGARQFQEAIAAYQKAQRSDPANADIHYLLGSAYHQTGQLEAALAQYKQCTSGNYSAIAANHVRKLEKKLK